MRPMSDFMTTAPRVAANNSTLAWCAREFVAHDIRHLPVVDAHGRTVGLLHDFETFARGSLLGTDGHLWIDLSTPEHNTKNAGDAATQCPSMPAESDLMEALSLMLQTGSDAVVVVDEEGRPEGIFTEIDGLAHAGELVALDLPIALSPLREACVVGPDTTVAEAGVRMVRERTRHLLVLEPDGSLRAVVSWADVVEAGVDPKRRMAELMRHQTTRHLVGTPTLGEVVAMMQRHKIGCIPVVDPSCRALGVITRRDVMESILKAG
jgi:CBS domain-containing protein